MDWVLLISFSSGYFFLLYTMHLLVMVYYIDYLYIVQIWPVCSYPARSQGYPEGNDVRNWCNSIATRNTTLAWIKFTFTHLAFLMCAHWCMCIHTYVYICTHLYMCVPKNSHVYAPLHYYSPSHCLVWSLVIAFVMNKILSLVKLVEVVKIEKRIYSLRLLTTKSS